MNASSSSKNDPHTLGPMIQAEMQFTHPTFIPQIQRFRGITLTSKSVPILAMARFETMGFGAGHICLEVGAKDKERRQYVLC